MRTYIAIDFNLHHAPCTIALCMFTLWTEHFSSLSFQNTHLRCTMQMHETNSLSISPLWFNELRSIFNIQWEITVMYYYYSDRRDSECWAKFVLLTWTCLMFNAPMNYELTDDVEIFPFFSAFNTSNHRQAYLNRTKVITLAHNRALKIFIIICSVIIIDSDSVSVEWWTYVECRMHKGLIRNATLAPFGS